MATVLVVEDQEEVGALIRFKLRSAGFDILAAENGKIGLEMARSKRPDLIIMDVMMPIMNGLEALAYLKGDPELSTIPVILLTAMSDEQQVVDGLELGADDYITKPFNTNVFVARVKAVLGRYKKA